MNRLVHLATSTIRVLKDRYPGATKFTFTIEVDKEEFGDSDFSKQLLELLALRELEQQKGWKACEQFFLSCALANSPVKLGDKEFWLKEKENESSPSLSSL